MRLLFHPDFPKDVVRFANQYRSISTKLELRFRAEVAAALDRIKASPSGAGHFLNTSSNVVREVRRRNLVSFPHFVLYGVHNENVVIGALIPGASDPLTWLARFSNPT